MDKEVWCGCESPESLTLTYNRWQNAREKNCEREGRLTFCQPLHRYGTKCDGERKILWGFRPRFADSLLSQLSYTPGVKFSSNSGDFLVFLLLFLSGTDYPCHKEVLTKPHTFPVACKRYTRGDKEGTILIWTPYSAANRRRNATLTRFPTMPESRSKPAPTASISLTVWETTQRTFFAAMINKQSGNRSKGSFRFVWLFRDNKPPAMLVE